MCLLLEEGEDTVFPEAGDIMPPETERLLLDEDDPLLPKEEDVLLLGGGDLLVPEEEGLHPWKKNFFSWKKIVFRKNCFFFQ